MEGRDRIFLTMELCRTIVIVRDAIANAVQRFLWIEHPANPVRKLRPQRNVNRTPNMSATKGKERSLNSYARGLMIAQDLFSGTHKNIRTS
jgi:hypothetical protein